MKYIRLFEEFLGKIYNNIDTTDYDVYYQIPFKWFYDGKQFGDDYKLFLGDKFIYDYIKDEEISKELESDLSDIDLGSRWESESWHSGDNKNKIHTRRIAKLVQSLLKNEPLKPISFWISEDSYLHDCYNFIEDGNHRLRALQYLKYDYFPAYVYGTHEKFVLQELENEKLY